MNACKQTNKQTNMQYWTNACDYFLERNEAARGPDRKVVAVEDHNKGR